jgi:hypothetical protein
LWVPHLGNTNIIVIILRVSIIIFVDVVSGANWWEGEKQEFFFRVKKKSHFFTRKIKIELPNWN